MPSRSTLPEPSGQPSPSSSSRSTTARMPRTEKSYSSSRKRSSPVQRQIRATALGYLTVSSVLKLYALAGVPKSWPNQFEPSEITSWVTMPESR